MLQCATSYRDWTADVLRHEGRCRKCRLNQRMVKAAGRLRPAARADRVVLAWYKWAARQG